MIAMTLPLNRHSRENSLLEFVFLSDKYYRNNLLSNSRRRQGWFNTEKDGVEEKELPGEYEVDGI